MRRFDPWPEHRSDLHVRVSILVLVDEALRHVITLEALKALGAFQSLFWWMRRFDDRPANVSVIGPDGFQSLFWWMRRFDPAGPRDLGSAPDVSILVLVDEALRPVPRQLPIGGWLLVSILVLVDEALRHTTVTGTIIATVPVSILVLVDEALRHTVRMARSLPISVSILVLVDEALRPHYGNKSLFSKKLGRNLKWL